MLFGVAVDRRDGSKIRGAGRCVPTVPTQRGPVQGMTENAKTKPAPKCQAELRDALAYALTIHSEKKLARLLDVDPREIARWQTGTVKIPPYALAAFRHFAGQLPLHDRTKCHFCCNSVAEPSDKTSPPDPSRFDELRRLSPAADRYLGGIRKAGR